MPSSRQNIAILGGGASGFFAAIQCARLNPAAQVFLLEKTGRCLAKVKVSGGGRCNVTHACFDHRQLVHHYPRGSRQLLGLFSRFGPADTVEWFLQHGVELKTEADGRMFPVTNSSQTIIDCLQQAAQECGVVVELNSNVKQLLPLDSGYALTFENGDKRVVDKVLVATGGSPTAAGFAWIQALGIDIVPPVPSLFSFNISGTANLMGCSVQQAAVTIKDHGVRTEGPLLFTHWGMSGPAILRLSSEAAPLLNRLGYRFRIAITWAVGMHEEQLRETLAAQRNEFGTRQAGSHPLFGLTRRLWEYLLSRAGVEPAMQWAHTTREQVHKLVQVFLRDEYAVSGKTTFKEEFVTCGGVDLGEVDMKTMESKKHKGLFFAGEVLDIDGITGGFNFQAAWSTGFVAGTAMAINV